MTPEEQQGIRYLYERNWGFFHLLKMVRRLRHQNGLFIKNECMRYAALSLSAQSQFKFSRLEVYQSEFQIAIRGITRDNVNADHIHAFVLMASINADRNMWESVHGYLNCAATLLYDVIHQNVATNWSPEDFGLGELIFTIRELAAQMPIIGSQPLKPIEKLNALKLSLLQLTQVEVRFDVPFPGNPTKLSTLAACNHDIAFDIRQCFVEHLIAKSTGRPSTQTVTPLLQQIQQRFQVLENDSLFRDLAGLDMEFLFQKSLPQMTTGPICYGKCYHESGIAPALQRVDDVDRVGHYTNVFGEDFPLSPARSSNLEQQKQWFKTVTGGPRRNFWARYYRNIMLLGMIETMIYGYSARDVGDAAIKIVVLAGELQTQIPLTSPRNFPTHAFSLAELQLRLLGSSRAEGMKTFIV